jgi:hypothetical protein
VKGYLARLSVGRYILWCYFFGWIVVAVRHFDPSPRIWLTSLGLSLVIGAALLINATSSSPEGSRVGRWAAFRFFLIPFCVSSFSALVKDRGVFPPRPAELAVTGGLCAALGGAAWAARRRRRAA